MRLTRLRVDLLAVFYYLLAGFILAPLAIVMLVSLTPSRYLDIPTTQFSLRWYADLLNQRYFIDAFWKSLLLAIATALTSIVLGTAAAFALLRYRFPGKGLLDLVFMSPLIVPLVITGIAMLQFLAALRWNGSFQGLFIAHVIITVPYVIRIVSASLRSIDRNLELAAMNLGANWPRAVFAVTLPLIRPGLLAAATFAFLVSFDNLTVSLFLAGPSYTTLPVQIFSFVSDQNSPLIAAVSSVLILISLSLMLILERFFGLRRLFGG